MITSVHHIHLLYIEHVHAHAHRDISSDTKHIAAYSNMHPLTA